MYDFRSIYSTFCVVNLEETISDKIFLQLIRLILFIIIYEYMKIISLYSYDEFFFFTDEFTD